MKTIKEPNYDIWGKDPISAKKQRYNEPNTSCCSCNCGLDGEDGHLTCTGSVSN